MMVVVLVDYHGGICARFWDSWFGAAATAGANS